MIKNPRLFPALVLGLSIGAPALAATGPQTMPSHGWIAGPVTDIDASQVSMQGMTLPLASTTRCVGEDSSGALVTLDPENLKTGDLATVFYTTGGDGAEVTAIYRGSTFMLQGQVTDMQVGTAGRVGMVTLDGQYHVRVDQTTFDGMNPGNMGNGMGGDMSGGMGSGGMMSGGSGGGMGGGMGGGTMGGGDPGDPSLLQMGSTVAMGGIVEGGHYAAVFAHVMASSMQWSGTVQSMTYDSSGAVTGFMMNRGGHNQTVVMDSHTRVTRSGQSMTGSSMRPGMHVNVAGLSRQDGSMLATAVLVQGHM